MMENIQKTLEENIAYVINDTMANITDIEVELNIVRTLLGDTADGLFDKYEKTPIRKVYKNGREYPIADINDVILMWHTIRHYEPYISAITDYLSRMPDKLERSHQALDEAHTQLKENREKLLHKIINYQAIAEKKVGELNDQYGKAEAENIVDIDLKLQYWRGSNDAYKNVLRAINYCSHG